MGASEYPADELEDGAEADIRYKLCRSRIIYKRSGSEKKL